MIGAARPPISTSPPTTGRAARRRRSRCGTVATLASAASVWRRPYDSRAPPARRLTNDTRAFSAMTGRRSAAASATPGPGEIAVHRDPGPDERAPGRRVGEGAGRVGGVDGDGVERARRRSASTSSKRASWPAVYGSSGSSATARWVNTPARRRRGATVRWPRRGPARRRRGADAVHAGVDLEVDVEAVPAPARPRASMPAGVVTVGVRRLATIVGGVLGRLLAEHEDRARRCRPRAAPRPLRSGRRTARRTRRRAPPGRPRRRRARSRRP